jgi:hypothetical protein
MSFLHAGPTYRRAYCDGTNMCSYPAYNTALPDIISKGTGIHNSDSGCSNSNGSDVSRPSFISNYVSRPFSNMINSLTIDVDEHIYMDVSPHIVNHHVSSACVAGMSKPSTNIAMASTYHRPVKLDSDDDSSDGSDSNESNDGVDDIDKAIELSKLYYIAEYEEPISSQSLCPPEAESLPPAAPSSSSQVPQSQVVDVDERTFVTIDSRTPISSSSDTPISSDCAVCMDERRCIMFKPCGHVCCCESCADTILASQSKRCPLCRQDLTSRSKTKVYI